MPGSISHHRRAAPQASLLWWLVNYASATPGVSAGANGLVRLDAAQEARPDGYLLILPSHGGRVRFTSDGGLEGAPELVVEVADRLTGLDLKARQAIYRRNDVQEHLLWRVDDGAMDWWLLQDGQYEPLPEAERGCLHSEAFPGLWLDPAALLRGDLPAVHAALQHGLASPEHSAFANALADATQPEE